MPSSHRAVRRRNDRGTLSPAKRVTTEDLRIATHLDRGLKKRVEIPNLSRRFVEVFNCCNTLGRFPSSSAFFTKRRLLSSSLRARAFESDSWSRFITSGFHVEIVEAAHGSR